MRLGLKDFAFNAVASIQIDSTACCACIFHCLRDFVDKYFLIVVSLLGRFCRYDQLYHRLIFYIFFTGGCNYRPSIMEVCTTEYEVGVLVRTRYSGYLRHPRITFGGQWRADGVVAKKYLGDESFKGWLTVESRLCSSLVVAGFPVTHIIGRWVQLTVT